LCSLSYFAGWNPVLWLDSVWSFAMQIGTGTVSP
jgi:hypothetical protein